MLELSACYAVNAQVYSGGRDATPAVTWSELRLSLKRNFKINFTRERKRSGLLQKDVAKAIGVSEKTVSRWMDEGDDAPDPDLRNVEKLCRLFNCDFGDLLSTPPDVESKAPKGPVTIVLTGDPAKIARTLSDIQSKWSRDS